MEMAKPHIELFQFWKMGTRNNATSPTFHLPGLNGIRAIAAFLVLISHIWQFQYWFGFKEPEFVPYQAAGLGVTLFFVLSGYLITYLLILEKDRFQKISLKKFYIRRILRIWPLYYLVLIISVFLLDNSATTCTLYCFFLMPNVAVALTCVASVIVPLWSIGVEEQFYLAWPLLVSKSKNIAIALTGVIVLYLAVKLAIRFFGSDTAYTFISLTRIDCMAVGGLGAWWATSNRLGERLIFTTGVQLIAWMTFLAGCFGMLAFIPGFITHEFFSAFFVIIILNVSLNTNALFRLENYVFDWVGRISYGIYLIHLLVLFLMSKLIEQRFTSMPAGKFFYTVLNVSLVMTLAYLSHRYFEQFFIRAKTQFMVVKSDDRKK
jgi:peptidoglycan/LPS O-acetylase OafA/YrhL